MQRKTWKSFKSIVQKFSRNFSQSLVSVNGLGLTTQLLYIQLLLVTLLPWSLSSPQANFVNGYKKQKLSTEALCEPHCHAVTDHEQNLTMLLVLLLFVSPIVKQECYISVSRLILYFYSSSHKDHAGQKHGSLYWAVSTDEEPWCRNNLCKWAAQRASNTSHGPWHVLQYSGELALKWMSHSIHSIRLVVEISMQTCRFTTWMSQFLRFKIFGVRLSFKTWKRSGPNFKWTGGKNQVITNQICLFLGFECSPSLKHNSPLMTNRASSEQCTMFTHPTVHHTCPCCSEYGCKNQLCSLLIYITLLCKPVSCRQNLQHSQLMKNKNWIFCPLTELHVRVFFVKFAISTDMKNIRFWWTRKSTSSEVAFYLLGLR